MIIPFNDKYRINSDKHAWFIQEYSGTYPDKETGEMRERWNGVKWYPTFEMTLRGARDLAVRTSSAETCPDALDEIKTVQAACEKAMQEYKDLIILEASYQDIEAALDVQRRKG